MTEPGEGGFNVLWDPWIRIEQDDGSERLGSYRDILVGVADGRDVWHPRDDMKVYTRVLLSALTQALFPTATLEELRSCVRKPLGPDQVDPVLESRRAEFELLGAGPRFLQAAARPADAGTDETERLFPDLHPLFKEGVPVLGLCRPCMTVALYGIQAFAPAGGRGYAQCIRGSSSITNLVVSNSSLRADLWNGTLCERWIREKLDAQWSAQQTSLPWMLDANAEKPANEVTLVDTLFWMPRVLWVDPLSGPDERACALCSQKGQEVLQVSYFAAGSRVTDGFVRHPHAPVRFHQKLKQWQNQRLSDGRPAWTGLAEMVMHNLHSDNGFQPAPVVTQWRDWNPDEPLHLLCHAVPYDKIKVLRRFSEQFTLSMDRWHQREDDALALVQSLVQKAAEVLKALLKGLARGRPGDPTFRIDSFWKEEASVEFWRETESEFWTAVHGLEENLDASMAFAERWEAALRRIALHLFREHTQAAALDNSQMLPIARAQRRLYRDLAQILTTTQTEARKVPA